VAVDADPVEIRVLGALIEKQRTTPDVYPLSLNSLRLACNQSTNRDPVVEYDVPTIRAALDRLSRKGWVRLASGPGSRAAKFRHLFDDAIGLDDKETAVLTVLMLRGPQTPGELKQRTQRLHEFGGLDEIETVLGGLIDRDLAERLPRRPGQKEERYRQLLGEPAPEEPAEPAPSARGRPAPPPFAFTGRTALVTGCGSERGIGFACARLLARLGADVAVTSTTDRIEARARELEAEGATVSAHVADLTDRRQAFELISAAQAEHGPLDVLVNAAGLAQVGCDPVEAPFLELTPEDWRRELDVTLTTAFHATQAALPGMVERGYGRIVFVSSVTGPLVTAPGSAAYAAAKGGLDGMMRTVALEHGRSGITANSVAPGWIATASSTPEELEAARHTPVGRPGTPDEVAAVVAFLASEPAAYVTGESIVIDGGNTIQEPHGIDLYGA
jgi:3-oxoacyl-[acyl-carrier protein] reductase